MQRINPATNRVVKTVAFGAGALPAGIGFAGGALWVGDDHGRFVTRIDPKTFRLARVRSGGLGASWIATAGQRRLGLEHQERLGLANRRRRPVASSPPSTSGISPVNLDVVGGDVGVPDDLGNQVVRIDGTTRERSSR